MISLVDFSQTIIAAVSVEPKAIQGEDSKNMVKHIALNQILSMKKRFKPTKVILCCDASSKEYWRTEHFPSYKGHRKHSKDKGFLDWDLVYKTIEELKVELAEYFPYHVLEVNGAEADDIIAVLVKHFSKNEFISNGLFEEPSPITIISTDNDFQQLQKYKNVQQWNNVQKKLIKCSNPKQYIIGHICTGDSGDNIPNICTDDQWSIDRANNIPTRALSFMNHRLDTFYDKGINACESGKEIINYSRNERLVDLDFIPADIHDKIINTYNNSTISGSKAKVFKYLSDRRMRLLSASYQEF